MTVIDIDARSPNRTFDKFLIDSNLIANFHTNYARDHDYRHYGFDFISSELDAESFLSELDKQAELKAPFSTTCQKAESIRRSLKRPDSLKLGAVNFFKFHASSARRICCSCHETGSFFPN
jgi:hypothetical protein